MTGPPTETVRWERLHPLSFVVRGGRATITLVVLLLVSSAGTGRSGRGTSVVVDASLIGLAVLLGVVHWLVTRWAFDGTTLRIETGLIRRDSRRLPVARIQSVDVVQPVLARMFGLAELKVQVGGASHDSRLAYLPAQRAEQLRAMLLGAHHGAGGDTTLAPPQQAMAEVPTGRLVGSVVLSGPMAVLVVLGAGLAVLAGVSTRAAQGLLAGSAVYLFGLATGVWRRFNDQYRFTLAAADDGLRVHRGLLGTVSESIPLGRVQALRQVEPMWWRLLGWCRLEVDLAGVPGREQAAGSGQVIRTLLPVGPLALAERLRAEVIGPVGFVPARPPGRARWKSPLSYHFLAAGHDDALAMAVTGRVRRVTCWIPLTKTQSVRRVQGPVQRRLGLATVHLDAAGKRVDAAFRDRDAAEAEQLTDELAALSRQARRLEVGGR